MIGIQLDGDNDFLEMPPDISISVKLENPILSDADRISPGSYSYPFNLPGGDKSPSNAAKLKNPDVMENNEAYTIQKASLFASSDASSNVIPFKKGNLKIDASDKDKISSYFTFGLSTISEDFKTAKLRDVVNEDFVIGSSAITKKVFFKRTVAGDYSVKINGTTYTASSINNLVIFINLDADAGLDSGQYLPYATEVLVGSSPSTLIASPYVELKLSLYYTYHDPVLDLDFWLRQDATDPLLLLHVTTEQPDDYIIEANIGSYYSEYDAFLSDYLSGSYPNNKLRFPITLNANPHSESLKEGELVNGVNTAGFIKNDPNWGLNNGSPFKIKNYNSLQPFLRRKWILDKIAETFGFAWDGDFYDHTDVENMLEWNTGGLDYPLLFIGETKFVFWKRSFNLSELVPDITVVEYLNRMKSRYNLATYYNETTQRVRICFRENIARSIAYDDITPISSPSKGIDDQRVTGFSLICKKDDTDSFSLDESVLVGIPEVDVDITCGRLFQMDGAVIDVKHVSAPRVSQKYGDKGMMRTFYYKGLVDVTAFEYASADINGSEIIETLPDFFVVQGLFNKYWKYWLHYLQNSRSRKLNVAFPLRKLINFNWEQKHRFNRVNYLVKSIDVKITNNGIEVTNTELITQQ